MGEADLDANVDAENRRAALLRLVRWRMIGFIFGTLSFCLFLKCMGLCRGNFGATAFHWLSAIGMFVSFLAPLCLLELFLQRDARLHCPNCGSPLTAGILTMGEFIRKETCAKCNAGVPMAKATRRQKLATQAITLGGMLILLLVFWLIK